MISQIRTRPEQIDQRWRDIDRELQAIADLRVCATDPVAREGELLEKLDELEYEAGLIYSGASFMGWAKRGEPSSRERGASEKDKVSVGGCNFGHNLYIRGQAATASLRFSLAGII